MRGKITKTLIDGLRPGDVIADSDTRGFIARCLPSGAVSYGVRYRAAGRQRWLGLGTHGQITPAQARQLAKKRIGEVASERDPAAEREAQRASASCTVNTILDSFIERHVRHLRTARQVERAFDKYVRPHLGTRSIYTLKRGDIVGLLDDIEDQHGARQADAVLAYLRKGFNWQAARDDDFTPPIVRGMARTKPRERARKRILDDEEIGDLWTALDIAKVPAAFKNLVRVLLLTGQRRKRGCGNVLAGSRGGCVGDRSHAPLEGWREHCAADQEGARVLGDAQGKWLPVLDHQWPAAVLRVRQVQGRTRCRDCRAAPSGRSRGSGRAPRPCR